MRTKPCTCWKDPDCKGCKLEGKVQLMCAIAFISGIGTGILLGLL